MAHAQGEGLIPYRGPRRGRRKPYTERGISRVPCARCGASSSYQWQVCADGRLFRPLCARCDVALNRLVLRWMGFPDWKERVAAYAAREGGK